MSIVLKSKLLTVAKINHKTKARLFKDLEVGDKIELSIPLRYVGHNRGTTYATYIKTTSLKDGFTTLNSFNQLPKLLECFEFEEL